MPRSVNHVASRARRKKILNMAKGYFGARKNVWTVAKNAVEKGLGYAYRDRKAKKRQFRTLWIARINAAVRVQGISYSVFMGMYIKAGLGLNRKALADLAMNHPETFLAVVKTVQNAKPAPVKQPVFTPAHMLTLPEIVSKKDRAAAKKTGIVHLTATPKVAKAAKPAPAPKVAKPAAAPKVVAVAAAAPVVAAAAPQKSAKADDLKIVEGVGPAIEKLFHAKDITTYAQLADTSVETMQAILDEAGSRYRVHNPGTWAAQSALARDGKFEELKVLQDELNGGK
jgi:large subunit ribosomal protein L20